MRPPLIVRMLVRSNVESAGGLGGDFVRCAVAGCAIGPSLAFDTFF
jgi:hypothetical protein